VAGCTGAGCADFATALLALPPLLAVELFATGVGETTEAAIGAEAADIAGGAVGATLTPCVAAGAGV